MKDDQDDVAGLLKVAVSAWDAGYRAALTDDLNRTGVSGDPDPKFSRTRNPFRAPVTRMSGTVRVGDPDPTVDVDAQCLDPSPEGYLCTAEVGHDGPHIAAAAQGASVARVAAVWAGNR